MDPLYHLQTTDKNVAPYVLLPGDPHRVSIVASYWDTAEKIADNREHVTYTGTYKGMPITCTSTGMGCPSTAIALEELARCGAKTFLRMGTCAAIQSNIENGDILIFDSAYRADGTTSMYVPEGFPAVAHHDIITAAVQTVERMGLKYHIGTTYCRDALYSNRKEPGTSFNNYHPHTWDTFMDDLKQTGVLAMDMESSAVMVLPRLWGLRSGAICVNVVNFSKVADEGRTMNFSKDAHYSQDNISRLCQVACETMYQIYLNDQKKNLLPEC